MNSCHHVIHRLPNSRRCGSYSCCQWRHMDHKTAECISLQYADTDTNLIGACKQLVSRNSHITRDVSVASGISLNVDQQEIPREYLCNREEISKRCTCRVCKYYFVSILCIPGTNIAFQSILSLLIFKAI